MSPIPPLSFSAYRGIPVNFRAQGLQKQPPKTNASEKSDSDKKPIPWGKILIGTAVVAAGIEFILRRQPVRKTETLEYTKIFNSNPLNESRRFPNIPYRDETFINEALKGNQHAKELFHTITPDAPQYIKYVRLKEKIQRTEQYLKEGRFDIYRTKTQSASEIKKGVEKHLQELRQQADYIYRTYINPSAYL